jgi:hypothetical protein
MRTDIHQHLWSEPLVEALAARSEAPRIRRTGREWRLDLAGEPSCRIDVDGDAPGRRAGLVHVDGLDRALIAPSSPLGMERLPEDEARDLLAAYHEGALGLGEPFGAWGAVPLLSPDPADVDDVLDRGCAGLCLPSGALASPAALDRSGPLLERLADRGAPLFVHPGPLPWGLVAPATASPGWWPALTDYVAGMNAAWHAFAHRGRKAHPHLKVVFAMLAGGAPLHHERLTARGGPGGAAIDRDVFYDTSSYGPRMLDAMVRVVGIDQLVHGSDRPVVAPPIAPGPLGHAAWESMTRLNPGRLLRTAVPA